MDNSISEIKRGRPVGVIPARTPDPGLLSATTEPDDPLAKLTVPDQRRASPSAKRYQLCDLYSLHHEIIRRLSAGEKPKVIADDLDISLATVSNVRNTVLGRAKMRILMEQRDKEFAKATRRVTELIPRATDLLEVLLRKGEEIAEYDPSTTLKIIDKSYQYAGFTKKDSGVNINVGNMQINNGITAEDLATVRQATQRAQQEGAIVEAKVIEYTEADLTQVEVPITEDSVIPDAVMDLLVQDGFL